ncbi:BlaI/MecI/CopY family transcriptional regulator [Herbivorax sp. ANBcel31]|uniref:BlaI/MecI/CopY family transcriptional regulator n=1 Tax=Herbivorax sp. ANBcel31 TaxID=3069754 RepID=UPI0027B8613A|nr:BlaI/MecI/CopY family transcriptional regulator [Herbivorax sp. ANBcel31]MDQ2085824.1 BlaI/MecI/CopY family transcriptional regulator [Herbivorax sp. ANBcel31]
MAKLPQITDSEWIIMKVLWEKSPLVNKEIVKNVSKKSTWNKKTIETLLRRLVEKGAVGFNQVNGKIREYFPLIGKEECIKEESESFLKKVYDGSVSMLMAGFIKNKNVSKEELQKLKELINFDEEE